MVRGEYRGRDVGETSRGRICGSRKRRGNDGGNTMGERNEKVALGSVRGRGEGGRTGPGTPGL